MNLDFFKDHALRSIKMNCRLDAVRMKGLQFCHWHQSSPLNVLLL